MKCKNCGIETMRLCDDGLCQTCHRRAYQKTDKWKAYKKAWYLRNREQILAKKKEARKA